MVEPLRSSTETLFKKSVSMSFRACIKTPGVEAVENPVTGLTLFASMVNNHKIL